MKNNIFLDLFDIWLSVQTDLFEIKRWSRYLENKGLRVQSTLHHQYSVLSVVNVVLPLLKKHNPNLDELLVLRAFLVHDQPEGFSKKSFDCLVSLKTQEKDVGEYLLFKKYYEHLPREVYKVQEYAYLLQYALKENNLFPEDARKVMCCIVKNNSLEAMIFEALEYWEYIFYAYEGFIHHEDECVLTHVLRRSFPVLRKHALTIGGFREIVFTSDFEKWGGDFIDSHTHIANDQ